MRRPLQSTSTPSYSRQVRSLAQALHPLGSPGCCPMHARTNGMIMSSTQRHCLMMDNTQPLVGDTLRTHTYRHCSGGHSSMLWRKPSSASDVAAMPTLL